MIVDILGFEPQIGYAFFQGYRTNIVQGGGQRDPKCFFLIESQPLTEALTDVCHLVMMPGDNRTYKPQGKQ
jgi:hypothetical protein